jgi:hypothetical protein
MCKLCERDKKQIYYIDGTNNSVPIGCITLDRLAVLEKDHLAMERLRERKPTTIICAKGENLSLNYGDADIADEILAESDAILGWRNE